MAFLGERFCLTCGAIGGVPYDYDKVDSSLDVVTVVRGDV